MQFGKGLFDIENEFYHFPPTEKTQSVKKLDVGLPQWGVSEWKGRFYPNDLTQTDFLHYYSQKLNCVEVSSTFYAPVAENTLLSWERTVPEGFRFLPKWPKLITHDNGLQVENSLIHRFIGMMEHLGHKLGPTLLQLPPTFSTSYKRELFHFLERIPESFPVAVEFRNESWFENGRILPRLWDYLEKTKRFLVTTDAPAARKVFHTSFCSEQHIVRYVSDEMQEHDKLRLNAWSQWLQRGAPSVQLYFILHMPDNRLTPELIGEIDSERASSIIDSLQCPQQSFFL